MFTKIKNFFGRFSTGNLFYGNMIFVTWLYKKKKYFAISLDLNDIKFNWHNKFHIGFTALMTFILTLWFTDYFYAGYFAMFSWEIFDGTKPMWWEFKAVEGESKLRKFIRAEMLYADGFSLQDVLVHNLSGFLIGLLLAMMVAEIYSRFV